MRVVILGKQSYIGNHVGDWLASREESVSVDYVDSYTQWETYDFSGVDSVIHVAGIVHHPEITDWDIYRQVNVDLPLGVASRAKAAGVHQFVFFSTMGVYGRGKRLKPNYITKDDTPNSKTPYGKSKYMAEQGLRELEGQDFKVVVIRPPNVYGKGCPGGYISGFMSVVKRLPSIPACYENVKQSMIYIDNLCELVRYIVKKKLDGVFEPQDENAVSAVELMMGIASGMGLKRKKSRLLGICVMLFSFLPIVKKAYGGIEYEKNKSVFTGFHYVVTAFDQAIKNTVS
ncbi:MAG: NAD-dependent epimerase/dehydratase family protein [Clostridia bacterium]|nr:NAD-dependent epimerase/dehydratase family protein [Clostridia bacterium]